MAAICKHRANHTKPLRNEYRSRSRSGVAYAGQPRFHRPVLADLYQ